MTARSTKVLPCSCQILCSVLLPNCPGTSSQQERCLHLSRFSLRFAFCVLRLCFVPGLGSWVKASKCYDCIRQDLVCSIYVACNVINVACPECVRCPKWFHHLEVLTFRSISFWRGVSHRVTISVPGLDTRNSLHCICACNHCRWRCQGLAALTSLFFKLVKLLFWFFCQLLGDYVAY